MAAGDDVQNTVKKVESIDHTAGDNGGANAAYQQLKQEYDQYAKTHKPEETKGYWKGVTEQLTADSVLPDLSVAWGKEQKIDNESAFSIQRSGKYSDGSRDAEIDKVMSSTLAANIEKLDTSGGGWFGGSPDARISGQEIDKYLDTQSKNNQKNAEFQVGRDQQSALFKGEPPLISVLDGMSADGKVDGAISRSDMQKFCADYDTQSRIDPDFKSKVFTKENRDYVQNILDGNNPAVPAQGFSPQSLTRFSGVAESPVITDADGYKDVVEKFNQSQPKPDSKVAETPTNTTPDSSEKPPADNATAMNAFLEKNKDATAHRSTEGPYAAAARLLGEGAKPVDIHKLATSFKESWQDLDGHGGRKNNTMRGLKTGYEWLNKDNFDKVLEANPTLKTKFDESQKTTG